MREKIDFDVGADRVATCRFRVGPEEQARFTCLEISADVTTRRTVAYGNLAREVELANDRIAARCGVAIVTPHRVKLGIATKLDGGRGASVIGEYTA